MAENKLPRDTRLLLEASEIRECEYRDGSLESVPVGAGERFSVCVTGNCARPNIAHHRTVWSRTVLVIAIYFCTHTKSSHFPTSWGGWTGDRERKFIA